VTEAILATGQCRTAVAERWQTAATSAAFGAGNWGCETTSGSATAVTKYVLSIATDTAGAVTTSNATDLGAAANKTITLTPYKDATTAVAATDTPPLQVFTFKCANGGGAPLDKKYLPGSRK
jgi:type IV pilus assembly protein PilA